MLLKFIQNKPLFYGAGSLGIAVLLLFITLSALTLGENMSRQALDASDQQVITTQGDLAGSVSKLSGKVVSTQNLNGLTLRINQIETCAQQNLSAYVAVASEAGTVNKGLRKQDVKVFLDGKEVTNFTFKPVDTSKIPLSNVLAIDHSGSMAGAAIDNAKAAATSYIGKLGASDSYALVQFDDKVEVLISPTTDKSRAAGVIAGIQARGDTAVYDAIERSLSLAPQCGRKAVTVLSDGDDTKSQTATSDSVIKLANKVNLPVFSVGIKGEGFTPAKLKTISESTGGQYLEANTPGEVSELYTKIDGQLSGQFVAEVPLPKKGGTEHRLKIVSTIEGSDTTSERSFVY